MTQYVDTRPILISYESRVYFIDTDAEECFAVDATISVSHEKFFAVLKSASKKDLLSIPMGEKCNFYWERKKT